MFKSNTVPLLTADPSVRAASSGLCSSAHLHGSLKAKAVESSIIGALRNSFWGKINLFTEVYGVSPSSMTAGSIVDAFASLSPSPHSAYGFSPQRLGRQEAVLEPPLWLLRTGAKKIQLDFQGRKKGLIPKEKWTSWLLYCCFSSAFFSAAAPLGLVEPQVLRGLFPGMVWPPGWVQSARLAMCPAPLDCCTLRHFLTKFLPFFFPFQGIFHPALARKHLQAVRETSLR